MIDTYASLSIGTQFGIVLTLGIVTCIITVFLVAAALDSKWKSQRLRALAKLLKCDTAELAGKYC
jgi:hypothetical protein